jgi:hypothetical protein
MNGTSERNRSVLRFLASRWICGAIWTLGLLFLVGYLALGGDWRVSIPWALAYVGISLLVGWFFSVVPRLHERLPALDRYLLLDGEDNAASKPMTRDEWSLAYARFHLNTGLRTKVGYSPSFLGTS